MKNRGISEDYYYGGNLEVFESIEDFAKSLQKQGLVKYEHYKIFLNKIKKISMV